MHGPINYIKKLWCTTSLGSQELNQYASRQMLSETRKGVMAMSMLLFGLIFAALPLYVELKLHPVYLYTYLLIAILCIHIFLSARKITDIKTLYLLGITLLTISATAFVSIAHQTSNFSVLLFANVVLLFMAVPMVPWGIREASIVIFVIYALLTLSTSGMSARFGSDTLLVLQFFMIAAAMTSIILVARSVRVRKDDLSTRFDLEQARAHLFELSNVDPLTGAWNRRYLPTATAKLISDFSGRSDSFHYALFDIDEFKLINDHCGHDIGDRVLQCIGSKFADALDGNGYLLRFGGDEFALIFVADDAEKFIDGIIDEIEMHFARDPDCTRPVTMSYGLITAPLSSDVTTTALYHRADKSLYESKRQAKAGYEEITSSQAVA